MSNKDQMIKKLGSYEAYKTYLKELSSRGGKKSKSPPNHPTRFDNNPELAKRAGKASWKKFLETLDNK